MNFFKKIGKFISKYVFATNWRCLSCGEEVFEGEDFCEKCYKTLPFNDKHICNHCGRATKVDEEYCLTCKNVLTDLDICRSAFIYKEPINSCIRKYKYDGKRYFKEVFPKYLTALYYKYRLTADAVVCIPMTAKAERKRGFNHAKLLAEEFSRKTGVEFLDVLEKTKETKRQAGLNREERLENLKGAFRLKSRKAVRDKTVIIIDDVTTTGTTAQTVAKILKKGGAKRVYLLTIASVPAVNNS